jgi:hypothetical protein
MPKPQQSWVWSQHPPTQFNLRAAGEAVLNTVHRKNIKKSPCFIFAATNQNEWKVGNRIGAGFRSTRQVSSTWKDIQVIFISTICWTAFLVPGSGISVSESPHNEVFETTAHPSAQVYAVHWRKILPENKKGNIFWDILEVIAMDG